MPFREHLDLLGALVTGRHATAAERFRDAAFDADDFRRFLATHQLSGCVAALLADAPVRRLLPPGLAASLRTAHEEQRARNRRLLGELKRLRDRFIDAGMPMIALKGPYLAQRFYGAIDRRRFWDLDVLVRGHDRPAAGRILASAGYARDSRVLLHERLSAHFTHAADYAGPDGRLDLHWALARHPSYRLDYRALWAAAHPYVLDGCELTVLSDEYEIVFSVLSCLRDIERGRLRMRSLVDLHMILQGTRGNVDWAAFFGGRERENIAGICRAVLSLLLHAFRSQADLPELSTALAARPAAATMDGDEALALLEPSRHAWRAKRWSWRLHGMSAPALLIWWAVSLPFRVTVHRTHRSRAAAPVAS